MKNKTKPLISIVVLNYNGLNYLKKTIPPILDLNYQNYEIIVVDNGSSDGSIEFIKKNKKVKLLESPKKTIKNFACNYAIKNTAGRYILLLDEDILIGDKNFLQKIKDYFEKLNNQQKIGFLSPLLVDVGCENTKYYGLYFALFGKRINQSINLNKIKERLKPIEIGSFHGGALFFLKKTWLELGGYDEDYRFGMSDYDTGLRAILFGYKNYLFNQPLIHLGKNKDENKKHFANKFIYYYEGIPTTIFKNYSKKNFILGIFVFGIYAMILNIYLVVSRRNVYLLKSPFFALVGFIKKLPKTIKKRKMIQLRRVIKDDVFLKIDPPEFN